ncbi:unnamed protein product [Chironomus riparius]|uniref:SAM-dependent MTase RsmB/NOP-type domain-containing protein n=1 Tax=Chironomus riparius TaxID=315576 RepID=A0A9N9RTX3_9DIPT|nr:unnamed protein product [Chironomus riparius]
MSEENENPVYRKINVPTQYRQAAKILQQVSEGKSLKDLVYNNKHIRVGTTIAMLNKIQANERQLDQIIGKTDILQKIPNKYLATYLVAELIFGRGELSGFSKPVECVRSYHDQLKEALLDLGEAPKLHTNLYHKVPRYVRLNTLLMKKAEAMEYFEREGWRYIENTFETYEEFLESVRNLDDESYLSDFHIKNLFVFPPSSKKYFASNELAAEGKFLLQDKASCLPSFLLNPPHKSTVLDMCSAPGNKTTHLAAMMKNKGKIYAVEMNTRRYNTLVEMTQATNATIIQTINRDVLEIKDEDVPNVEYILLDPSCSGSGIANRSMSDTHKDLSRLYKLSGLQFKLLSHAMISFPNVTRIVYSTCSIYPEENEEVVMSCLSKIGNFRLVNAGEILNNKWKNYGNEKSYPGIGQNVLYASNDDDCSDLTNGFFVAVLEKFDGLNEFYLQKQQNISAFSEKFGKRKTEVTGEENPDENNEKPVKKKKKWINKCYQ